MRLYLHEFPSSEGLCYLALNEIREIKFEHYSVVSNKTYVIIVRFRWCNVKVEVINIECLLFHVVVLPDELLTFKDMCADLFTLFNKYNEFYWLPRVQIPKELGRRFYDQILELYHNPLP